MGSPRHISSCLSYCWKVKQIILMVTCTSIFLFLTFMSSYFSIVIVPNKKPDTVLFPFNLRTYQMSAVFFHWNFFYIDFKCDDRIFIDFFSHKKVCFFLLQTQKSKTNLSYCMKMFCRSYFFLIWTILLKYLLLYLEYQ